MPFRLITIIVSLFTLIACNNEQSPSLSPKIASIIQSDPNKDALRSFTKGDYRFISVHNHDPIPPRNIPSCLVEKMGNRELSNESFQYGGYDFQRYGALAELYANWYNYALWETLEENGLSDC